VMQSEEKRLQLNTITHPKIRLSILQQLLQYRTQGHQFAIVEAALMIETQSHKQYDALIVVTCSAQIQRERLMSREGFDVDTAKKWIDSQMALAEKERHADILIDNSGNRADLKREVATGWAQLQALLSSPTNQ